MRSWLSLPPRWPPCRRRMATLCRSQYSAKGRGNGIRRFTGLVGGLPNRKHAPLLTGRYSPSFQDLWVERNDADGYLLEAIQQLWTDSGFSKLFNFANGGWKNLIMIAISCVLIYIWQSRNNTNPFAFLGIGAMTDFGPLISNPKSLLLGAAAQLGIFITFIGARHPAGI